MARRTRFTGQSRPRRKKGWEEGPGTSSVVNFTGSSTAILGSGLQVLFDGLTLARVRGNLSTFLVSANSAGDGFQCAMGIGIVTLEAFTVGVTAVPHPMSNIAWDGWLYHRFFSVHVGDKTAGDVAYQQTQFEVDSKAMRKLKDDDVIMAVMQVVETGVADMDVFFDSRALFMLP